MSTEKLKPCPFCGGEAEIQADGDCDVSWSVTRVNIECCECAAEMYFTDMSAAYDEKRSSEMIPTAVALWNERACDSENAELKAKIEKVSGDALSNYYENLELKAKVAELEDELNNVIAGLHSESDINRIKADAIIEAGIMLDNLKEFAANLKRGES